MPRIRYVNSASTAGGDGTTSATSGANRAYNSVTDAMTAELGSSAMTEDVTIIVDGALSGGSALGNVTVWGNAWTATGYTLTIEAAEASRHAGVWDAGKVNLVKNTTGSCLDVTFKSAGGTLVVRGFQFELGGASGSTFDRFINCSGATDTGTIVIDRCIFRRTGARPRPLGIRNDRTNASALLVLVNSIGIGLNGLHYSVSTGTTSYEYNCGAIDCDNSFFNQAASTHVVRNCWTQDETSAGYSNVDTSATNLSEDATSPQTLLRSIVLDFVDKANGNYRLASTDTEAIDAGTDLSADSIYPFDWDITGATRTGTWEIGPFNYSAPGFTITSVTPSTFDDGRTGIVIAGSGFGASQGSSTLTIGGQAQTVTAWSDTSITFTSVRGSNSMGTRSLTITRA